MPRPSDHNSVSLFPFLAVLVCAMGVLILLLLVTTRRIRMEAVERAYQAAQAAEAAEQLESPPQAPSDEPAPALAEVDPPAARTGEPEIPPTLAVAADPPIEAPRPPLRPYDPNPELRARVASLVAERDGAEQRLHALAAELAAARDRDQQLQAQLADARLKQDEARSERERAGDQVANFEGEQRLLRAQIHAVDRQIREVQQQPVAVSRFVVVPYDGVSGTNRRPILIEFTGDGIRFIPEGVVLRRSDFDGFTPGYNPLLAGARALVDYWTEHSRRSGGQEPLPYVLLIVRPSGVGCYPLRLLLERLEQPFGYELLEETQELALPPVDPGAAEACRIAVERMLAQRNALLQIVRGNQQHDPGDGDAPAGVNGFARADEGDGPPGLWEESPSGDGVATEHRGPVFRGNQRPSYDLVEPDTGIVLNQPQRSMLVHRPGGRRGGGPGAVVGEEPGPRLPGDQTASRTANASSGFGNFADPGNGADPSAAGRAAVARMVPNPSGGDSGWAPFQISGNDEEATFGQPEQPGTFASELRPSAGPESLGGFPSDAELLDPFGAALRNELTSDGAGEWHGASNSTLSADSHMTRSASSNHLAQPYGAAPGTGSAATSGQMGFGSGASAGSASGDGNGSPVPTMLLPPISLRDIALADQQAHRRRWGFSSPRATIGYERKVQIDVSADRLVVGGEYAVPAGRGETREALVARVVTAIEATARSWGPPPDAFYWIPALEFTVAPGGNVHYERLRRPLREWGLPSSATYTLDAPRTAGRSLP